MLADRSFPQISVSSIGFIVKVVPWNVHVVHYFSFFYWLDFGLSMHSCIWEIVILSNEENNEILLRLSM